MWFAEPLLDAAGPDYERTDHAFTLAMAFWVSVSAGPCRAAPGGHLSPTRAATTNPCCSAVCRRATRRGDVLRRHLARAAFFPRSSASRLVRYMRRAVAVFATTDSPRSSASRLVRYRFAILHAELSEHSMARNEHADKLSNPHDDDGAMARNEHAYRCRSCRDP
jgi:hypothetical protein